MSPVDSPTSPPQHNRVETTFFFRRRTSIGTRSVLIFTISKRLRVHTTYHHQFVFSISYTYLLLFPSRVRDRDTNSGIRLHYIMADIRLVVIIISSLHHNTYYPYCPCMERVLSQPSAQQQSVTSSR